MRIVGHSTRVSAAGALLAVILLCLSALTSSALAAGEGPGWELSAASYPTNFKDGEDEVQEVAPEAATFTLSYEGKETASMSEATTASTIQAELEKLSSIGSGDVSVDRAGGANGPFTVTFTKYLGDMQVASLGGSGVSTSVQTGGAASGTIEVGVFNIGASASNGAVTVTDTLPHGIKAKEAGLLESPGYYGSRFGVDPVIAKEGWDCTGNGGGSAPGVAGASVVTCTNDQSALGFIKGGGGTLTYEWAENKPNQAEPAIGIAVEVEPGASEGGKAGTEANHVSITGGEAPEPASTEDPVTISKEPAKGGLVSADAWLSNADGTIDRQAGSHPYEATFVFTSATALNAEKQGYLPDGGVRNLETEVPPGLIGDLHDLPQCSRQQLLRLGQCPPATMIGRLTAALLGFGHVSKQVFNMAPPPGVPAELGFFYEAPVYIQFHVNTGGNYSVVAKVNNLTQYGEPFTSILTLWGTPQEASHSIWRGGSGGCGEGSGPGEMNGPAYNGTVINYCQAIANPVLNPFLRLPTSCGAPPSFAFRELRSWGEPSTESEISFRAHGADDQSAGFTGCESLSFEPAIITSPDAAKTDTPTGLTVEVKPPLGGLDSAFGLGSADLENTTVALPVGVVINPGQAVGLTACGSAEDGLTSETEKAKGEEDDGPAHCPNTSKVGTVTIKTPLIEADEEKQFEGNVYVLQSNPPELKLLVAASADGVNLKLVGVASLCEAAGEVLDGKTCEAAGQVITTFKETPQLPFTDFKLSFSGGPQAALDTPEKCATYTSNADFTPWSSPAIPDALTSAAFSLAEGPNGSACPGATLPFSPELTAGSTRDQAGGYTNFSLLLRRGDGQQRIAGLQFKAPAGLTGFLSHVPLCTNAQAEANACPVSSKIGHTVVESGPGPYPLVVPEPGRGEAPIYLTESYGGAPFGLSIVVPLYVGPFELPTQRVRAKIAIDPRTSALTITTNELPQVVAGVPTDLREIDAVIERPEFMVNPTSCNPQEFSGRAYGAPAPGQNEPSQTAEIGSRFGMGSCQQLKFEPQITVSTSAHPSKADGASLNYKVTYPNVPQGTEADVGYVKVELPKQLPSRLTTLQKACTQAQFQANPAGCPAASIVGRATVHTPLLPVALEGPAYFVSNGGEAFPNLVIVLQGDGVKIELVGDTFISKTGVTSTTFKTVPDDPFSSFELTLPQGPYSALAANGNLCEQKLVMPNELTGQNGAPLKQNTQIETEGCPGTLAFTKHTVKGQTASITVYAPAAGKLTLNGKGLKATSKTIKGRETITVKLSQKKAGKLKTTLRATFTPSTGKTRRKQTKTLHLQFKK